MEPNRRRSQSIKPCSSQAPKACFPACTTGDITTYLPVLSWGLSGPNAYTTIIKYSAWPKVNTQIIIYKRIKKKDTLPSGGKKKGAEKIKRSENKTHLTTREANARQHHSYAK